MTGQSTGHICSDVIVFFNISIIELIYCNLFVLLSMFKCDFYDVQRQKDDFMLMLKGLVQESHCSRSSSSSNNF